MAHPRVEKMSKIQENHFEKISIIEEIENQDYQRNVNEQQQNNLNIYMLDTNIQIVDMKIQNQDFQKQFRLRKLQARNR